MEIINSLPDDDKPSFFGLPANIERSSQRIISSQVSLWCFTLPFSSLSKKKKERKKEREREREREKKKE